MWNFLAGMAAVYFVSAIVVLCAVRELSKISILEEQQEPNHEPPTPRSPEHGSPRLRKD
jgi:hypothetical protein